MAETGRRIVVHCGLHKTGTSAVQAFFRDNGPALWPHAALLLPHRTRPGLIRPALAASRGTAGAFDVFSEVAADFLAEVQLGNRRHLLISDENLGGRMPGHEDATGYPVLPELMRRLAGVLAARWPEARLTFVLTVRSAEPWLRSLWAHHVRDRRLTETAGDFAARMAPAADHAALLRRLAAAVSPHAAVPVPADTAGPLGPAGAILDLLGLPAGTTADLRPIRRVGEAPPAQVTASLLALNRERLSEADHVRARARLLEERE